MPSHVVCLCKVLTARSPPAKCTTVMVPESFSLTWTHSGGLANEEFDASGDAGLARRNIGE